jgi:hypothetical protein
MHGVTVGVDPIADLLALASLVLTVLLQRQSQSVQDPFKKNASNLPYGSLIAVAC